MIFRANVKRKEPGGVAFVDRDGTLIEDNGYLSDPSRIFPIGDAVSSLQNLKKSGFAIFLISNQAGLAKGKIKLKEFNQVKRQFDALFDAKMTIFDGIFYCPHHVDGIVRELKRSCSCRKPGTLMVETAMNFLRKPPSLNRIYSVGDKTIDIMMGKSMGYQTILVETGYGKGDKDKITDPLMLPDYIARNFDEAVRIMAEKL